MEKLKIGKTKKTGLCSHKSYSRKETRLLLLQTYTVSLVQSSTALKSSTLHRPVVLPLCHRPTATWTSFPTPSLCWMSTLMTIALTRWKHLLPLKTAQTVQVYNWNSSYRRTQFFLHFFNQGIWVLSLHASSARRCCYSEYGIYQNQQNRSLDWRQHKP